MLAFALADLATGTNRLAVLPTVGGSIREIEITRSARFDHLDIHVDWTPDGRFLLVIGYNKTHDATGLFRVPVEGGEPVLITELPVDQNTRFLRLSPDGRRIAFTAGNGRGEIWAMENIPGTGDGLRAERP
jgi:Tol biopolymer transport system component